MRDDVIESNGCLDMIRKARIHAKAPLVLALNVIVAFKKPRSRAMADCMWTIADMALSCEQLYPYAPKTLGQYVYWHRAGKVLGGHVRSIGPYLGAKPARVFRKGVLYRPHISDYCDASGVRSMAVSAKRGLS